MSASTTDSKETIPPSSSSGTVGFKIGKVTFTGSFTASSSVLITGFPLPTPSPSPVPLLPRGKHLLPPAPGSMAALAPPPREEEHARLTLSDQKIFKYGSYWMRLEIRKNFRTTLGLSDDDIIEAGLNVRCRKVGRLSGWWFSLA